MVKHSMTGHGTFVVRSTEMTGYAWAFGDIAWRMEKGEWRIRNEWWTIGTVMGNGK